MAQQRADTAVVSALVPFCIAKAERDPNQAALVKFRAEESSYSRRDLVMKAGWATIGGMETPSSDLARACSDKLHHTKTG